MDFFFKLTPGVGIYYDEVKTTSGQRFFGHLRHELEGVIIPSEKRPSTLLFNISAPITEILKAKLRGQTIILRVDSLYFDRLSDTFISKFRWPLRLIFTLSLRYNIAKNFSTFLANFLNENYTAFARMFLANFIIYQSDFSRLVHQKYFPNKISTIILNATSIKESVKEPDTRNVKLKLVTIYDEYRPSKRIHDIVHFVEWVNKSKPVKIDLTILGYTGKLPQSVSEDVKKLIEGSDFIKTVPRFTHFDSSISSALYQSDIYITFSYKDSCPNAVIEAMAYNLPVVGIESGGLPDIVGKGGELFPWNDFETGFFSAHRFESDFPAIDFEKMYGLVMKIAKNPDVYRSYVKMRFEEELDIKVAASKYLKAIKYFMSLGNAK